MAARVTKKNRTKQTHYAHWKQKYKKALIAECYLECILIDYAMIEDRLLSLLAHLRVAQRHDERKPGWIGYADVKGVVKDVCNPILRANGSLPALNSLSVKVGVIEEICTCSKRYGVEESLYGQWLTEDAAAILRECGILGICEGVKAWKETRNEYVHALFGNHEYEAEDETLRAFAERGMELALALDAAVKKLKFAERRYEALRAKRARCQ